MRARVGLSVLVDCGDIAKAIKSKLYMKAIVFDELQAVKHLLFNISFNTEEIFFEEEDVYGLTQSDFYHHFKDGIITQLRRFTENPDFAEFQLIKLEGNIAIYNIENLVYEDK